MRITVFGASGKVGKLVVEEALARGHEVVAFVHSSNPFQPRNNLSVQRGDVHSSPDMEKAIRGSQCAISAVGSWGTKEKDIVSAAVGNIIPAMEHARLQRFVGLTGTAAFASTDTPSLGDRIGHTLFGLVAAKIQQDGEASIKLLQASSLDWTMVRSPGMTEAGATSYTLTGKFPPPWKTVSRKSVAKSLVDLAESTKFLHQAPFITKG